MQTSDFVSGKSRGYVLVTAAAAPPGPSGAPPPRSPMRILAAILVASFLLGIVVGGTVQTIRVKRRFRRASATNASA
jgi:hypothetical protein